MLLVDSHVHYHECFDSDEFFSSVFNNFSLKAIDPRVKDDWIGILCLTEMRNTDFFSKLLNNNILLRKFNIKQTNEKESVIVENELGSKICLISGKQILAKNGIEVLALGSSEEFKENKDLDSTVESIINNNAVAVLPWGVGKWTGKRKKILEEFVEGSNKKYFLGDNSGRPSFWNGPSLFKSAVKKNNFVLCGSDALPIASEVNKTGSYGFYLNESIDLQRPSYSFKEILLNLNKQPESFGSLESPLRFFKNQFMMQFKKHISK
jgi:hypothetical protein